MSKPGIPDWQRASADSPASSPEPEEPNAQQPAQAPTPTEEDIPSADSEEAPSANTEDTSVESENLLEQASRFLEDPTIRDAPRERKVAFLESKGVGPEDIESLLDGEIEETSPVELSEAGERAWSTVSVLSAEGSRSSLLASLKAHLQDILLIFLGTPKTHRTCRNQTATARYTTDRHIS